MKHKKSFPKKINYFIVGMFQKDLYFAACMYPFDYTHNFTVLIFCYRLEKLWASWILMFCFTHVQEMVQISAPRFPRWVENNSFPTWYVFSFLILWHNAYKVCLE